MIARDRLMRAMAASFTDAELEAMRIAVALEQQVRTEEKALKLRRTSLASHPPAAAESAQAGQQGATTGPRRTASTIRPKVSARNSAARTGTE